jgi:hypothetical protein
MTGLAGLQCQQAGPLSCVADRWHMPALHVCLHDRSFLPARGLHVVQHSTPHSMVDVRPAEMALHSTIMYGTLLELCMSHLSGSLTHSGGPSWQLRERPLPTAPSTAPLSLGTPWSCLVAWA